MLETSKISEGKTQGMNHDRPRFTVNNHIAAILAVYKGQANTTTVLKVLEKSAYLSSSQKSHSLMLAVPVGGVDGISAATYGWRSNSPGTLVITTLDADGYCVTGLQ